MAPFNDNIPDTSFKNGEKVAEIIRIEPFEECTGFSLFTEKKGFRTREHYDIDPESLAPLPREKKIMEVRPW